MEVFGVAAAAVGLAGQLFKTSMDCYDILYDTKTIGTDHDHFIWQLKTERGRLIEWGNSWGLSGDRGQKLDQHDHRYLYAVETLARIIFLFTSADSLGTKYGIQARNPDQDTTSPQPQDEKRGRRKRNSWLSVDFSFRSRSRSPGGAKAKLSVPVALPGLDASGATTLENPSIFKNKDLAPELEREISRLKETAKEMQDILPFYKKLQWAIVDKTRSSELIGKLKEYNDGLSAIFSGPQSPQSTTASRSFSKFNIPMQLPVQRNHHFRGRDDLLEEIDRILNPRFKTTEDSIDKTNVTPRRQTAVLHGLGGMGKSQIAGEYAYRHYSDSSYTSVFWVDATSPASLAQSAVLMIEQIIAHYQTKWEDSRPDFSQIGAMLGFSGVIEPTGKIKLDKGSSDPLLTAKKWLSDPENKHWLVIFDNNDDIDSVKLHDFFPALDFGHGSIIITTRRFEIKHLGTGVEIDKIEETAAISIILTSAGKISSTTEEDQDYIEASKIAERLGYFPLALDQAGGYISAKQMPISEYLKFYTTNYKRVASKSHQGLAERYRNDTIFTTWKISFDSLPQPASELLLLCAFLGGVDIPEELLFRGRRTIPLLFEGYFLIDDALEPLLSFSLAKRKGDTQPTYPKLSFHPLVLEWARESLDTTGRQKYIKQAVCLVGATHQQDENKERIRTLDEWAFGMRILNHIDIALSNIRTLLSKDDIWSEDMICALGQIGDYRLSHGQYTEQIEIFENFLSSCSKSEESSYGTIKVMSKLAFAYTHVDRYAESVELNKKVLNLQERLLGKDHPDTLETSNDIGWILCRLGKPDESLELLKQSLADRERILGKEHPDALETAHNMASPLRELGRVEEAVELYKQVLASREKVLGKEHPNTLNTAHNMADSLHKVGRVEEAVELYKQVLASREKVLGKEHPSTLNTAHNMAYSLDKLGRVEEAVELYKQALASGEKVLGKEHPNTLSTAHNMADSLHKLGRVEEAVELYKQVLASREKILGKEHPNTLSTAHNMADSLHKLGRVEEAVELYKQALASGEKMLGKEHPKTLSTAHNMADSLHKVGRVEEAVELYKQVLASREKVLGKEHPHTLISAGNLSYAMKSLRRSQSLHWSQKIN